MRPLSYLNAIAKNRAGRPTPPSFLTYIVTFTCNARCIMCDSWKKDSKGDLELSEIEGIFAQLPKLDSVRLTGGEPFVRKDLLEIATLAQTRLDPYFLHITTNGFLTDRIVAFCEKRPKTTPLRLLVSVDGVGDKHNQVRGRETAWDSVVKTLRAVAPRAKEFNLRLSVNQTIVDAEGVEHYRRLREFLKPLGVHNNVVMAYDVSATYSVKQELNVAPKEMGKFCTFGKFEKEELEDLTSEIERDLEHFPTLDRVAKRYYLKGIRNRLLHERATPNPPCVALNSHLRIFPNGDVPTCQFNTKTVGNLREKSFQEIWHGEAIAPQRDWVRKCPGCWAECEVLPSAVYTGDLIKETLVPGP